MARYGPSELAAQLGRPAGPSTRRLEFLVTAGPARPVGVFELTDGSDRATVVRFSLELQPTGFTRLMTPIIARQMRREGAQLETLKRYWNEPMSREPRPAVLKAKPPR